AELLDGLDGARHEHEIPRGSLARVAQAIPDLRAGLDAETARPRPGWQRDCSVQSLPTGSSRLGSGAPVGTADSPGLHVRNLRTFPPLARRCARDRGSGSHLVWIGRLPPRFTRTPEAVTRAVQPAGPGQAPGLDEGHSLSALWNLASAGPPSAESQPRISLRGRARFRQRVPLARPLARNQGRPGRGLPRAEAIRSRPLGRDHRPPSLEGGRFPGIRLERRSAPVSWRSQPPSALYLDRQGCPVRRGCRRELGLGPAAVTGSRDDPGNVPVRVPGSARRGGRARGLVADRAWPLVEPAL